MTRPSDQWRPEWALAPGDILDARRGLERLAYCMQGSLDLRSPVRRLVWIRPMRRLLSPLDQFRGKSVLEIGIGAGRMSCLFAALGARVTGLDIAPVEQAQEEARRWRCEERVRFSTYDGDYDHLPREEFDVLFTKSMIGCSDMRRYGSLIANLAARLAPGGVGLFAENVTNPLLYALRRHVTYRHETWDHYEFGLGRATVERFRSAFADVEIRRYCGLVWTIRARRGQRGAATSLQKP